MLKSAQKMKLPDVDCFTRELERLEPELEQSEAARQCLGARRHRGPARSQQRRDAGCRTASSQLQNALVSGEIETPAQAKQAIDEMTRQEKEARRDVESHWLFTVRASLSKNRSTFAVIPTGELLRPDGFLSTLRDLGYEVESPS